MPQSAEEYALAPGVAETVIETYRRRASAISERPDLEAFISDRDRIRIGLVALANQERQLILHHHAQRTASPGRHRRPS